MEILEAVTHHTVFAVTFRLNSRFLMDRYECGPENGQQLHLSETAV
jgi:hypothetical protein